MNNISFWDVTQYRGESLMTWAIRWFTTSNDAFYATYGFNFNPYEYPGLYEAARKRVYPEDRGGVRWFE